MNTFQFTGCGGGFEYLTAGKYAEDFGMVEESCSPYHSQSNDCNREHRNKCKKYYFSNYEYVGGYYGRLVVFDFSSFVMTFRSKIDNKEINLNNCHSAEYSVI